MTEEQIQRVAAAIVEALRTLDAKPPIETGAAGPAVRVGPAGGQEACCVAIHIDLGATRRGREECC